MKNFLVIVFAFLLFIPAAYAQQSQPEISPVPEMPVPIQELVNQGAQARFLGKDNGLDAWITVKNGQEQYFYVLPDKSGFVMGLLFDSNGKMVTAQQVKRLQQQGDTLLDTLAEDANSYNENNKKEAVEFKSPSEQLYYDIENSNWVALGQANAPIAYSFIDPQCPHCHDFIDELRKSGAFDKGRIQLRMIPVGFRDETKAQAAFLLATPNPQERWMKHMDGDPEALPAKKEINDQGVQRNLAVMQSWEFNVTPMVVYRGKDGTVKLVRGKPKDIEAFISDLGTHS